MTPAQLAVIAAQIAVARSASAALLTQAAAASNIADALQAMVDADAPPPAPTYTLTVDPPQVAEGALLTFRLATTHVGAGTELSYSLTGIGAGDVAGPLSGLLVVGSDGTAELPVQITADSLTEGAETVTCTLAGLASASAQIRDTSIAPPPPPPPPGLVWIKSRVIDPLMAVLIEGGYVTSRYERGQRPVIWSGSGIKTVEVKGYRFDGGSPRALVGQQITLLIDWQPHQTVQRSGDVVSFSINLDALSEGPHWLDVKAGPGETCIPLAVYRRRGDAAQPHGAMPIVTHSHDMLFPTVGRHEEMLWSPLPAERYTVHYGMVPARFEPQVTPLPVRECLPAPTPLPAVEYVCTQIAPSRMSDIHRATLTADGVMTTSGVQAYHYSDFVAKLPVWALLDGPRGHGTVTAPTHLHIGRSGKVYGVDPWRMFKVGADGTVTTLVGYRHREPPSNFTAASQNLELVGDWSAIPAERRGMHEAWGMAWDERTLGVVDGAPPPPGETESPHVTGPVAFISDTQNNRVLRVEFSPVSHSVPAKVTEQIVGLMDPWDIACADGVLYISERTGHRIVAHDATTGQRVRVLVSGADLGYVDGSRKPRLRPGVTRAQARAQQCCLPEGIFLHDGWLYYGSLAQQQIRRVSLSSGALETVLDPYFDGNSIFCKFAISDGTFFPRGSLFVVTWSNRKYGFPHVYLPDGTEASFLPGDLTRGKGSIWADGGYTTAVAVGQGRVVCGYVQEGLTMASRTLPTDPAFPTGAGAGALDYWRRGFRSLHGVNGWGHYGLPLPWGQTPEIDAFLTYCGHRKET